jgi:hypothetical protein
LCSLLRFFNVNAHSAPLWLPPGGRILTLSSQSVHLVPEGRRTEQFVSAFRASLCLPARHRRHDIRRISPSWDAPSALSWSAKDTAASQGHRGGHQRGRTSVRCCKGQPLDFHLGQSVPLRALATQPGRPHVPLLAKQGINQLAIPIDGSDASNLSASSTWSV